MDRSNVNPGLQHLTAWRCIVVLIVLALCQSAVAGETSLRLAIEPGSSPTQAQQLLFTQRDGNFRISGSSRYELFAVVNTPSSSQRWSFRFNAPTHQPIGVGVFTEPSGFYAPFVIDGTGITCGSATGTFQIKQISYAQDNSISQFWAIFIAHCRGGSPAFIGELRFNAAVVVDVTAPQELFSHRTNPLVFTVTATEIYGHNVALSAVGLPSGASFIDNHNNTGTFAWTPTSDQAGVFRVRFDAASGQSASQSTTTDITVFGDTLLSLSSQAGDPVGRGGRFLFRLADGPFSVEGSSYGVRVTFGTFSSDQYWYLAFSPPIGQQLKAGTYTGAVGKSPYGAQDRPHLAVNSGTDACDSETSIGSFQIKQLTVGIQGLTSFWAAFEQRCAVGKPALTGEIRYNSGLLVVNAPEKELLQRSDTLMFTVAATDVLDRIATISATSLPPGAQFIDNRDNTGTFVWTPSFDKKGKFTAIFQADNGHGNVAATMTEIAILGETALVLDSERGDFVGLGRKQFALVPEDGTARASNFGRQVTLSFNTQLPIGPLSFGAPRDQRLLPGYYANATGSPFQDLDHPSFEVSIFGASCSDSSTTFYVKQADYDPSGSVTAFWALFEHHCLGQAPALFGEVRYNADITVVAKAPYRKFAMPDQPVDLDVIATDIQGRSLSLTATGLPGGATFTDNGNNTGTLRWTPASNQQGTFTVIFRAENGQGGSDTVSTTINIPAQLTVTASGNGVVRSEGVVCPGDCGDTYPNGTTLFLVAEPARGFVVDQWSGCDSVMGNSCTLRLTQNKTVSVTFTRITYRLTVVATSQNGSVSGNGINCPGDCVRRCK